MALPPTSPADPRPDDKPYYIDSDCPECGTELVLYDEYHEDELPGGDIWHDSWWCPDCDDGLHMDWPDSMYERLERRSNAGSEKFVPMEDV